MKSKESENVSVVTFADAVNKAYDSIVVSCPDCSSKDVEFSEVRCGYPCFSAYDCKKCGCTFYVNIETGGHFVKCQICDNLHCPRRSSCAVCKRRVRKGERP